MFVPACDRPSVAEQTEAQDRAVMETKSATIHRKMPMRARQLPITGFAHKAPLIGDDFVGAVFAARDMPAESRRATALDRRHHLQLAKAHMAGVGFAPRRSMVAEDIRDLEIWPPHDCQGLGGWLGASGLQRGQAIQRAHDVADGVGGNARVERGRVELGVAQQPRGIVIISLCHWK